MKLSVYAIRDAKAEVYMQPWFAKAQPEAIRNFQGLTLDDKSLISKFPEDFDLYHLGEYDDSLGILSPLDTPKHIAKANNFKKA